MNEEPLYEYRKGQGWVATYNQLFDDKYEILDIRTDTSKPGAWRYQIWLIGVESYRYKDWVDNHFNGLWVDANDLRKTLTCDCLTHLNNLVDKGAKIRVLHVDADGGYNIVPRGT
jgi:hypothetical protein